MFNMVDAANKERWALALFQKVRKSLENIHLEANFTHGSFPKHPSPRSLFLSPSLFSPKTKPL